MQRLNELITGTKYCGPFTTYTGKPTSILDAICRQHDITYSEYISAGGYPYIKFNNADLKMLKRMWKEASWNTRGFWLSLAGIGGKALIQPWDLSEDNDEDMGWNNYKRNPWDWMGQGDRRRQSKKPRFNIPDDWISRNQYDEGKSYPAPNLPPNVGGTKRRKYNNTMSTGGYHTNAVVRPRINRKRRRKFRKKGRGGYKLSTRKLLSILSPSRTVKGISYQTFEVPANKSTFIEFNANGQELIHGNFHRWLTVMKAVKNTATETNFDGPQQVIWEYSATNFMFHNPNNHVIYIRFYELMPNKHSRADTTSPMEKMISDVSEVERFPAELINVRTDIVAQLTHKEPQQGVNSIVDGLSVPTWMHFKHFQDVHSEWKTIKRGRASIPPGGYTTWKQTSRYGSIKQTEFDGSASTPYIMSTRFMMMRVEAPFMNTSLVADDAEKQQCGHPGFSISMKIETTDVVRTPINNAHEIHSITDLSTGANAGAFVDAVGTLFTVASTVGALNAAKDNE